MVYSGAVSFDIHKPNVQAAGPNSIPTQSWTLHAHRRQRQQTKLQRQPPLFLALLRCPVSLSLCIAVTPSWFTFADADLDLEIYKMRPFSYAGHGRPISTVRSSPRKRSTWIDQTPTPTRESDRHVEYDSYSHSSFSRGTEAPSEPTVGSDGTREFWRIMSPL